MKSFTWLSKIAVLMLAMLLVPAAMGQAPNRVKVKVGLNAGSASVAGVFIGVDKGNFAAQGADVEVIYFDDPTLITAAVVSGDVDVGFLGLAAGIFNSAANQDIKLIGTALAEQRGYRSLALITNTGAYEAGLRSVAGMKGKRVGINALGSSTQLAAVLMGRKNGFEVPNASFVALGALPNIVSGVKTGAIDVGIIPGVLAAASEKAGGIKIVRWVGDEAQFDLVGIFSRGDAARRPGLIRFMRGYLQAMELFDSALQKDKGAQGAEPSAQAREVLAIVAKGARAPAEALKEALPYLVPDATVRQQSIKEQVDFWKEMRMSPANADPAKMVDTSILAEARRK